LDVYLDFKSIQMDDEDKEAYGGEVDGDAETIEE
jgi:hypothetical protein